MAPPPDTDPAAPAAGPVDEDAEALLGTVIDGRYRLDAPLGRGGMGLVFRAHHLGLRRQVAVKILHPSLAASPDVRSRFEREALASGKIDHPNCVNVYDTGRLADGSLYLAMELLEGQPLSDLLDREGQLPPARALHILAHILRGLGHIHAAGLIHRDIKPENIFLIRQGDDVDFAKVLDFGIAKPMDNSDLDDGVKLTQAGMAFGTPVYMAPEQALGNPIDGRADLYAAAVMAYEMLCGLPPFYSDDKLEVMSMHTARPVPAMRTRLARNARPVPAGIERLIARGLVKRPAERYLTAEVFLAAVEQALHSPDVERTEVELGGKPSATTGAHSLLADDGEVRITGAGEFATEVASQQIADAIDDVLAVPGVTTAITPAVAMRAAPARPPRAQGGVGIGLPYTGPAGEPVFGLTPEQRLAQAVRPASARAVSRQDQSLASALEPDDRGRAATRAVGGRRRVVIVGGIAAAAVVVGVVIAVMTSRPAPRPGIDPASPAGQAMAALDRGRPAEAIELLTARAAEVADDPRAQLVLGLAHAARRNSGPALTAYGRALELDRGLGADVKLRASLRAMAGDKAPDVLAAAFELWVATADPEARRLLEKAAVSEDAARRHAVRPVIETRGLADGVEWWLAYAQDLEQEPSCELRKEAVARLRALEDLRAVPALERALVRKHKSGALRGKPFNGCLLDDAKAAIGYLRSLPPPVN